MADYGFSPATQRALAQAAHESKMEHHIREMRTHAARILKQAEDAAAAGYHREAAALRRMSEKIRDGLRPLIHRRTADPSAEPEAEGVMSTAARAPSRGHSEHYAKAVHRRGAGDEKGAKRAYYRFLREEKRDSTEDDRDDAWHVFWHGRRRGDPVEAPQPHAYKDAADALYNARALHEKGDLGASRAAYKHYLAETRVPEDEHDRHYLGFAKAQGTRDDERAMDSYEAAVQLINTDTPRAMRMFHTYLFYSGVPQDEWKKLSDAFLNEHYHEHVTETAKCIHFRGRDGWRSKEVRY